jgi:hypothetical protein
METKYPYRVKIIIINVLLEIIPIHNYEGGKIEVLLHAGSTL